MSVMTLNSQCSPQVLSSNARCGPSSADPGLVHQPLPLDCVEVSVVCQGVPGRAVARTPPCTGTQADEVPVREGNRQTSAVSSDISLANVRGCSWRRLVKREEG